jgi:Ca2+-binding EF-hand superfamily protein
VEEELKRFRRLAGKNGVITKAQYFDIMSQRVNQLGEEMLTAVFRSMDLDGDGYVQSSTHSCVNDC